MILPLLVAALIAQAPALDRRLLDEDPAALARAVRLRGDAVRGSAVFHRPHLACARCHEGPTPLGPDLARIGTEATDAYLIDSILNPSHILKKGYETVTVATVDGRVVTGLLAEDRPDAVVLRDPAKDGLPITIPRAQIEARKAEPTSTMPPGLVNGLASRGEFLDLVAYLRAIADGGPARALALRPDPATLNPPPPDSGLDIDHAGLIRLSDAESFKRGESIYERICANCHGTRDREGSMPTSPRFGSTPLKNGTDPYSLYKTLTLGFGQMPAQPGLVPSQKYDVIHYLRQAYLKDSPPVDRAYLAGLPQGRSRGPAPTVVEPWSAMDYGPSLMATYEVGDAGPNIARKGVAIRVDPGPGGVSRGRAWVAYDHDTLSFASAWTGRGFIDWNGINFNGRHEIHPKTVGNRRLINAPGPGWADPATGRFDDPRPLGRDGQPYGPLPRPWARYRGVYHHGERVILSYTVGKVDVLDMPGFEADPARNDVAIFTRTVEVGPTHAELFMRVAPSSVAVVLVGETRATLIERDGQTLLRFPASIAPARVELLLSTGDRAPLLLQDRITPPPSNLRDLTHGGPTRWPQTLTSELIVGRSDGPFAVDTLTHPESTPWHSQMRFTGLDFLPDGRSMVVCDWDGDVWRVDGFGSGVGLRWRRIASGLFQPLGLKVIDGNIYVGCRDQIAILRELNGDGEADFVECFNDDHQVTESFHEFAMDLQVDPSGNLYYAKAARHGKPAVVPQHGTLLRVSKDGTRTDILARGFRAPNGVCLNPDGTFFLTDQEGHWTPKNRINWVREGKFYGNMWGYHDITDSSDSAMEPPLCWITNAMDRSPSQVVRVESPSWGPLNGSLLSLSYGTGKVFIVPHERVGDRMQGGIAALPIPQAPTGLIRGRFRPEDGHLYACGMYAWAGDQQQPGGLYRIRATGKPSYLPIGLSARPDGLAISFTGPLDPASVSDLNGYKVKIWSLKRTTNYGSKHVDEHPIPVSSARLMNDGRTAVLTIPSIAPTPSMEVAYRLRAADGSPVVGVIHNTIHVLKEAP